MKSTTDKGVAGLARRYGSPALDMGTGVCACTEVAPACLGLSVTAIDYASSAIRMAQEQAAGKLSETMGVHHADASDLPFPTGSYRVTVAFDMLCHACDLAAILGEMFRVSNGVVVTSELNSADRQVTHHLDEGFEIKCLVCYRILQKLRVVRRCPSGDLHM